MRRVNLRRYGITLEQYDEMLERQGGACAICGGVQSRRLDVDHDHHTGVVRGLLCHLCNRALGLLREQPELFEIASEYILCAS